jgi:hypothetical protein
MVSAINLEHWSPFCFRQLVIDQRRVVEARQKLDFQGAFDSFFVRPSAYIYLSQIEAFATIQLLLV